MATLSIYFYQPESQPILYGICSCEFRGKNKDEILGKEAAKICKEISNTESVSPRSPEDIANQMLSLVMDNLKKHQEKPVEEVPTIDPQKYYLAIPFAETT